MATYTRVLPKYTPLPLIKVNGIPLNERPSIQFVNGLNTITQEQQEPKAEVVPTTQQYLPSGQQLPVMGTVLISKDNRTYYWEEKELQTRFQVIGKTIEQCSRVGGEEVGVFTGNVRYSDLFGNVRPVALQVITKFPFDRASNSTDTEYVLWIDTNVEYRTEQQIITDQKDDYNTVKPGSQQTSTTTTSGQQEAKKSWLPILAIVAAVLLLSKSKKR